MEPLEKRRKPALFSFGIELASRSAKGRVRCRLRFSGAADSGEALRRRALSVPRARPPLPRGRPRCSYLPGGDARRWAPPLPLRVLPPLAKDAVTIERRQIDPAASQVTDHMPRSALATRMRRRIMRYATSATAATMRATPMAAAAPRSHLASARPIRIPTTRIKSTDAMVNLMNTPALFPVGCRDLSTRGLFANAIFVIEPGRAAVIRDGRLSPSGSRPADEPPHAFPARTGGQHPHWCYQELQKQRCRWPAMNAARDAGCLSKWDGSSRTRSTASSPLDAMPTTATPWRRSRSVAPRETRRCRRRSGSGAPCH